MAVDGEGADGVRIRVWPSNAPLRLARSQQCVSRCCAPHAHHFTLTRLTDYTPWWPVSARPRLSQFNSLAAANALVPRARPATAARRTSQKTSATARRAHPRAPAAASLRRFPVSPRPGRRRSDYPALSFFHSDVFSTGANARYTVINGCIRPYLFTSQGRYQFPG
jgi:hypothetical protein